MDAFAKMLDWIKQPFAEPLDIFHLFLIVGIVLVMVMAWGLILYHMRSVAEEIV